MLHLIPPSAHRTAYRIAHALRMRWWRIRKPQLAGCRVVVLDEAERILLIRHSYGTGKWMLPGGGMERRETPLETAMRELHEETACLLADALELTVIEESIHGAGNRVHVIAGWTSDTPRADGREILVAEFFALHELPDDMAGNLRTSLPDWVTAMKAGRQAR